MFGIPHSSHQVAKPRPPLTAPEHTISPGGLPRPIGQLVNYFTMFQTTDIISIEKFHGGRIVSFGTQHGVTQFAALSDSKSWTNSHLAVQLRHVITTDWLSLLRPT